MGSRLARERPQRRQLGTRGLVVQGGREGVGQPQRPIGSRAAPERVDDAARQVVRGRLHAHAAQDSATGRHWYTSGMFSPVKER